LGGLKISDDYVKSWLFPLNYDRLTLPGNDHVTAFIGQATVSSKYTADLTKAVKGVTKNIDEFNVMEVKLMTFLTSIVQVLNN